MGQSLLKPFIFLPPTTSYELSNEFINIEIKSCVPFVLIQNQNPHAVFREHCILYSHGNAEDLGQITPLLHRFSEEFGISVAAYEYPGYGPLKEVQDSDEDGCYENAISAYEYLAHRFDPKKILIYGRSLGSGPAVHLAAYLTERDLPFSSLILQSPIKSIYDFAPISMTWVPFNVFENKSKIYHIKAPILILHGTEDIVVPYHHGADLAAIASDGDVSFWAIEGAGHNNIESAYWNKLRGAISFHLQRTCVPIMIYTEDFYQQQHEEHLRSHPEHLEGFYSEGIIDPEQLFVPIPGPSSEECT